MTVANPNQTGLANGKLTALIVRDSVQNDTISIQNVDFDDQRETRIEPTVRIARNTGEKICMSDMISGMEKTLRQLKSRKNAAPITLISPKVVAYDIWKFTYIESQNATKAPFIKFDGLYHDGIIQRVADLGFRKRKTPGKTGAENNQPWMLIRVDGAIIEPVEIGHIMNEFRARHIDPLLEPDAKYIEFEFRETKVKEYPLILRETFIRQQHNIFNEKTLLFNLESHDVPELKDTKTGAHFFFSNMIVKATKNGLEQYRYESVTNACIWRGRLIAHPYQANKLPGGHFEKFIRNVSRADTNPDRFNAFRSAIGYLLHNYNSSVMGQAVIAYDEIPAKKNEPAGGTGKGLFANGLKPLRNTAKLDGKAIKDDDRFKWQEVSQQTQIVWLDDPKPTFNFELLYSNLTDGWNIEYKREHKIYIPPEDSPKVLIATNTAIANAGSSNKRRQFIIEFSDHYSKRIINGNEEPIKTEHGRVFFSTNPDDNWTPTDWQQYFTFMLDCVKYYLNEGLSTYQHVNVKLNQLVIATCEEYAEWIDMENIVTTGAKEYDKAELFKKFREPFLGEESKLTQRTFTDWLKKWASIYGYRVDQRKSDGKGYIKFTGKSGVVVTD
jgi:hypothetical protein